MRNFMRLQLGGVSTAPMTGRSRVAAEQLNDIRTVLTTVFAVVPEFNQVRVESNDGHQYAITAKTPGVDWKSLRAGQRVKCTVTTTALPRVIEAHAVA